MSYINASTITVVHTIPVARIAEVTATRYHLEVYDKGAVTPTKTNVAAASLIAPTTGPDVAGSVTFTGVPTPSEGSYSFKVFYASNADLDVASFEQVGSGTTKRIAIVTTVTTA